MRKRLLFLSILLLLTFNILVVLNLNTVRVSAVESPYIAVVPDSIMDPTLTVGENFTVSIYTNYTGDDVWCYEFTLSYNPDVLHGGINYADAWTGDGSTTEWNTTYPPHYDSEKVYVNSVPKTPRMQGNDTWTGDGSVTVYVTTESPVVQFSEEVYVNETLKRRNEVNTDTWPGDGSTTEFFTTEQPLKPGSDDVWLNKTDTWPGDGSTTEFFTTEQPILSGTEKVYVNDNLQQRGVDYTITYATGNITFTTAPPNGEEVKASYRFKIMERNVDYTINYDTGTITFTAAPLNGVGIEARYKYGHYEIHYPSGTITFNDNTAPGAGSDINALYTYKVYDIEYAVDPVVGWYATIKFAKPPGAGDDIDVEYLYGGVDNGDLISFDDPYFAGFMPGFHNVTEGKLKRTTANLIALPFASTSGPGTLANVTFQVVGYGSSNITLGPETILIAAVTYIPIPGIQLEHGYFSNVVHDIAVTSVTVSPNMVEIGEPVSINVTVTNEGDFSETFNVTVSYDSISIDTQTDVSLGVGANTTLEFTWNTMGVESGIHTITANASIVPDETDTDNNVGWDQVTIIGPPVASFIYSPENPIVNESVTFNASASYDPDPDGEIVSYEWNFGDGNTTTTVNPIITHAYTAHGTYNITLNVTDIENKADTTWDIVTVREHPVAYFTYSPAAPIVGETVTFNASLSTPDGGTITSYAWNFGDGNTTTTVNPIITHAYTAEGTYNVTLTITDSEGLTDITYDIVTVQEPPPSGIPWYLYMAPAGVIAIVVVAIAFYFLRIRKPKPT